MTFDEFQVIVKPLAVHFGAVKDKPTWQLYHAALMVTPAPSKQLIRLALPRAASARRWFPSVEELRSDAETERRALLKAHPYEPCADCRDAGGWRTIQDAHGVARVQRCDCFQVYRRRLEALGAGAEPLSLPAAEQPV